MSDEISAVYALDDTRLADLGVDVPKWIDEDMCAYTLAAIAEGGCNSGAYMPACTYHEANETMAQYGDDVFDYLEKIGERPEDVFRNLWQIGWSVLAAHVLCYAIDAWARETLWFVYVEHCAPCANCKHPKHEHLDTKCLFSPTQWEE
jgi:nitrous oxide reductase accessory protein NosL